MILSFHPCYEAETNRLCAGRDPDDSDLAVIKKAAAVILPQGCRESLYRMASENCPHVFPNYDVRFCYPGKKGQATLFRAVNVPHPQTWTFDNLAQFEHWYQTATPIDFPIVFKLDWGGEGQTVSLLESRSDLDKALSKAMTFEQSGQPGFILQAMVLNSNRTLRVVVVGRTQKAYWRIQDNTQSFGTSLAQGARIDHEASAGLRRKALSLADRFCRQTRINLAGLDFIFDESASPGHDPQPLILEINYFFGRTGLGGSEAFYAILKSEIDDWLSGLGIDRHPLESTSTEAP